MRAVPAGPQHGQSLSSSVHPKGRCYSSRKGSPSASSRPVPPPGDCQLDGQGITPWPPQAPSALLSYAVGQRPFLSGRVTPFFSNGRGNF